jgi:hypothetical protein
MNKDFDPVSEVPLYSETLGTGQCPLSVVFLLTLYAFSILLFYCSDHAPVNVGWGKKETQFHGSLGKEAAKMKNEVHEFDTIVINLKQLPCS